MNKKIIVQEFDYSKTSCEVVSKFHFNTKSALPEDYILITTPFKTYMADPEDKIIYIQDKAYSTDELLELIEKADMYDGLCKYNKTMFSLTINNVLKEGKKYDTRTRKNIKGKV